MPLAYSSRLVLPAGGVVNSVTVTSSGAPAMTAPVTGAAAAVAGPLAAVAGRPVDADCVGATAVTTPWAPLARCSATTGAGRSGAVAWGSGLTTGAPVTTAMATTVATASLARATKAGLLAAAWPV